MEFITPEGLGWFAEQVIRESCRVLDMLALKLPYEPTELSPAHLAEILTMDDAERAEFRVANCQNQAI